MIHLVFSILCSTSILILFKTIERFKIDVFHVIIINYAIAFSMGLLLNKGMFDLKGPAVGQTSWIYLSALIGVGLIVMFFFIGISTQCAGISVTSIAGRVSVVIPMLFSILYYNETLTAVKTTGIFLALMALVCTSLKKKNTSFDKRYLYLPLILFIGMGSLDTLVKLVQEDFISKDMSALFTGSSFFFAFVSGIIVCLIKKVPLGQFLQKRVLAAGIFLGICNFGSMFFLINALNSNIFDSSVLFGINNIGVVALSVFSAAVFFKEELSILNWTGVFLSIAAILTFINT